MSVSKAEWSGAVTPVPDPQLLPASQAPHNLVLQRIHQACPATGLALTINQEQFCSFSLLRVIWNFW
jgi:hypothetical protein